MVATRTSTILLVNDEPVQRFRIASLLRKEGFRVKEAEDGAEAIRLLSTGFIPSLLITDLYMPEVDGWQLCRFLLEKRLKVPVLIISSYLEFGEVEEILRTLGVEGYLRYPCPSEELLAKVKGILEGEALSPKEKEAYRIVLLAPKENDFGSLVEVFQQAGFSLIRFFSLKEAVNALKEREFSLGLISSSFLPEDVLLLKQTAPYLSLFVLQQGVLKEDPFSYVLHGAKSVLPAAERAEYYLFVVERELKEQALYRGQELLHQKTRELEEISKNLVKIQNILELVVEQATDQGIVVTDEDFNPIFANPRAEEFFSLSPEKNFVGLLKLLLGSADWERIKKVIRQEDVFQSETKLGPEDKVLSLKVRAFSSEENSQDINGYVFFVQDLTKEREFQNQLIQMQRMEAIATLSAGIAHDFNNILAAIRLKGELLLDRIGKSHESTLKDILSLCDRAAQVVRQVIDTTRPSSFETGTCELNQQVKEALAFLRETIPRGINLHIELINSALYVPLAKGQLAQIILNLALNAIQAMGESGTLSFRTFWKEFQNERPGGFIPGRKKILKGPFACLVVEDTGPGISSEMLPKIFEPYFTTKTSSSFLSFARQKLNNAGSGLGLSVTQRMVEGAGGIIAVKSVLGKGTTFDIYLPLLTNFKPDELQEFLSTLAPVRMEGRTVLVVEDEQEIGNSLVFFLKSWGFEVQYYPSGEEALSEIEKGLDPVLLLVDLNLPGISGKELVKHLKEKNSAFKTIVITGYLSEEDKKFLEKCGVEKILYKPFTLKELRDTLVTMISSDEE